MVLAQSWTALLRHPMPMTHAFLQARASARKEDLLRKEDLPRKEDLASKDGGMALPAKGPESSAGLCGNEGEAATADGLIERIERSIQPREAQRDVLEQLRTAVTQAVERIKPPVLPPCLRTRGTTQGDPGSDLGDARRRSSRSACVREVLRVAYGGAAFAPARPATISTSEQSRRRARPDVRRAGGSAGMADGPARAIERARAAHATTAREPGGAAAAIGRDGTG